MLMVRVGDRPTDELRSRVRRGLIGGVIVFPTAATTTTDISRVIDNLQDGARAGGNPPLFVAVDQEGGDVKRFEEGPPTLSAPELGAAGGIAQAHSQGKATGTYLRGLGVNVNLAPVLDLAGYGSFMATRAFAADPRTVSDIGLSFARGIEAAGVIPVVKHFPGLGLAAASTDIEPSEITGSRKDLEPGIRPFGDAVRDRVPAVMVAVATYDALDPKRPAATSPKVVGELLRRELGYRGVVFTDDLQSGAVQAAASPGDAGVAAARAGADVLLYARDEAAGIERPLLRAVRKGDLRAGAVRKSCTRIVRLKHREFSSG